MKVEYESEEEKKAFYLSPKRVKREQTDDRLELNHEPLMEDLTSLFHFNRFFSNCQLKFEEHGYEWKFFFPFLLIN